MSGDIYKPFAPLVDKLRRVLDRERFAVVRRTVADVKRPDPKDDDDYRTVLIAADTLDRVRVYQVGKEIDWEHAFIMDRAPDARQALLRDMAQHMAYAMVKEGMLVVRDEKGRAVDDQWRSTDLEVKDRTVALMARLEIVTPANSKEHFSDQLDAAREQGARDMRARLADSVAEDLHNCGVNPAIRAGVRALILNADTPRERHE